MSSEIYWLTLTVIYSSLLFVPHTLYRMATTGPLKLFRGTSRSLWVGRVAQIAPI